MYDSRWRSLDSNGNPISGATLTVYTAGTTTPAAIFRDAALAVPMSNPTSGADKADSAGRFPQIFAAQGGLFDILEKDAVGSTLATYLSVGTLGGGASSFALDFTNSRAQITGSGGIASIEAGDATGDDVGGKMRLGGWNGTQADTISLDAAVTNSTGLITENAKKLSSVVNTASTAFAAASTVTIPLDAVPTGARAWRIDLFDMFTSGTYTALTATFSFDGGSSFKAGTAYDFQTNSIDNSDGAVQILGGATTAINFGTTHAGPANKPIHWTMEIVTAPAGSPSYGTRLKSLINSHNFNSPAKVQIATTNAICQGSSFGQATHIKITSGTGNISGNYRIAPLRGFGE